VTPTCLRCGSELADGYVCVRCTDRVRIALLGDDRRDDRPGLVDTAPAARDIAHGLTSAVGGGGSGKPGSRMPLHLSVTAKLDAVQGSVTTWARHVAEERSGAWWVADELDPIVVAAHYLAASLEWLRHRPECAEAFTDLEAAARVVRGIVRGPAEMRYLGPCGAALVGDEITRWRYDEETRGQSAIPEQYRPVVETCDGDVYGRNGAAKGSCRTCGAEVDQGERRLWLDETVLDHLADEPIPARDIAFALRLNVNTIRTWAHTVYGRNGTVIRAAKLKTYWRRDQHVVPWDDPDPRLPEPQRKALTADRGQRLHYVGDVQELAEKTADERQRRAARSTMVDTADHP
jgi:hypothetical protein